MGDAARRLLALSFAFALVFSALPGTSWTAQVDPAVTPDGFALIHVAHGTAAGVAAKAAAAGANDVAALEAIDVVVARLSPEATRALRSDTRVSFIAADTVVTAAGKQFDDDDDEDEDEDEDDKSKNDATPQSPLNYPIDVRRAWSKATGRGVTIAIMDTGVANHRDLDGSLVARVDFLHDGATSADPGGHGTFVAGLIAAHGKAFKGVAPDAKLVSLRVLDNRGNGTMHAVLAAFDWLLRNRVKYRIRLLNLSFGAPQATTYHKALLSGVVESAWFAGIAVVAASGNDGPKPGSVANPGADPFVITVGSLDDRGTATSTDDRESRFSGRGPTRDGFAKPDLLAPGERITSIRLYGSGDNSGPGKAPDGYGRLTGTSASSAVATGVAALLLQAHPNYSPTQVKGALVAGGRAVNGTRARALDAAESLSARPAKVNVGVKPSNVLLMVLKKSGQLPRDVDWAGVSWEGISWESVSWEGISWEAVSWESVTWESVTWESAWEAYR